MKDARAILFDLDGTLTDSGPSITNCLVYALEKMGEIPPPVEKLRKYIGPPLKHNFIDLVGEERAEEGIRHFRERMIGMNMAVIENSVYDGIIDVLERLVASGKELFVATSKLQVLAHAVIDHFDLACYFKQVYGCEHGAKDADKALIIRTALEEHRIDPQEAIMVGDRLYDIEGAKKNGVRSIGVGWGYGSQAELREAGADAFVPSPAALLTLLGVDS